MVVEEIDIALFTCGWVGGSAEGNIYSCVSEEMTCHSSRVGRITVSFQVVVPSQSRKR